VHREQIRVQTTHVGKDQEIVVSLRSLLIHVNGTKVSWK